MMYSTFLQSVGNYKYSLQKSQGKEEFFLYFLMPKAAANFKLFSRFYYQIVSKSYVRT